MFVAPPNLYAQNVFNLPTPGTMVALSPAFTPTILLGLEVDPSNPFKFQFIVDRGDEKLNQEELKKESEKVIRYFLAGLAVPEDALWVNLSPYEGDRVVDDVFGQTEMGRDLLAQDYMLKQITASLIYPEDELGRVFWQRIYKKAFDAYGTTTIPMNTFNKVWIMPDKATVYEHQNKAIIIEGDMKVMLEQDYVSLENNLFNTKLGLDRKKKGQDTKDVSTISSDVVREIVLPELYKEINTGKNFAQLRQIYNSLILANWFKQNLKQAVLNKLYSDKNKVGGIAIHDPNAVKEIYDQYLSAFKKGVCDYMKVEYDPYMKKQIPRKYFSGGYVGAPKVSVVTGPDGAQRAGSALNVIYDKAKDRIFEVSTFVAGGMQTMVQKTVDLIKKANSKDAIAKILTAATIVNLNVGISQAASNQGLVFPAGIVANAPAPSSPGPTLDLSDVAEEKKDEGFFKDISIVHQQKVGDVFYGDVSYTNANMAQTTLYVDAEMTTELGTLTAYRGRSDFNVRLKENLNKTFGFGTNMTISAENFASVTNNLLLSIAARKELATSFSNMTNPSAASYLQKNHPDFYNLVDALSEAGLGLDPKEVAEASLMINKLNFKTERSTFTQENPNYYRLTLFERHQDALVDQGFELHLRMMMSPNNAPVWLFRVVKKSGGGSFYFIDPSTENFTKRQQGNYYLSSKYSFSVLDSKNSDPIFKALGRVAAALPGHIYSTEEYASASAETKEILADIQKGLQDRMLGEEAKKGEIRLNTVAQEFSIRNPTAAKIIAQNGSAQFEVFAQKDVYQKGKTVLLGDKSGTMVWDKLRVAVEAFEKVFSTHGTDTVFVGDMTDASATIAKTTASDFIKTLDGLSKGQGATYLKDNVLKASALAGKNGTIIEVSDERPDNEANKIDDWPKDKVEKEIFNPLLSQLKAMNQRSLTYYIEKEGQPEAPLVTLKKEYAAAHPENPIFFIIKHQDNTSMESLVDKINEQYGKSEEIAMKISNIPIGNLDGLDQLQFASMDGAGNMIDVVDENNNSLVLDTFKSNDTVSAEQVKGSVVLNFNTGNVEGYVAREGTAKLSIKVLGKQTVTLTKTPSFKIFPFIDESGSMSIRGLGNSGSRMGSIKTWLTRSLPDSLKKDILGMASFSDGKAPEVVFFNNNTDFKKFVRGLSPNGGTYLQGNLKSFLDQLVSFCERERRPMRDDAGNPTPGFEEIHVPILTDGSTAAGKSNITPEYVKELKKHGIVVDFLIIDNQFPFEASQYVQRIDGLFTGAQGFFELARATGGQFYDNPNNHKEIPKIYNEYIEKLKGSFTGEIPSGPEYVEMTAYNETGSIIDQGIYKAETKGNLKDFQAKNQISIYKFENMEIFGWEDETGAFRPVKELGEAAIGALTKDTDLRVWVREGQGKLIRLTNDQLEKISVQLMGGSPAADQNLSSKKTSSSALVVPQESKQPEYGGIDFNVDQFNLKTKGEGIDMNVPFDESMLQNFNPDLIAPVIIQIVPMTNPQMILGLADEGSQPQAEQAIGS